MTRGIKNLLGGPTRSTFGITVTLRDLVTGQLESRQVIGPPHAAMLELAEAIDARTDGVWVVQTYSTPQTIYTDLVRGRDHDPRTKGEKHAENVVLGRIGRHDLCAPELLGMAREGRVEDQSRVSRMRQDERLAAFAARERAA